MSAKIKKILTILTVLILGIIMPASIKAQENIPDLVRCLREKNFVMYGTKYCTACAIQKEYFREYFQNITYIDCSEQPEVCASKKISSYPTWTDRSGNQYKGAIPPSTLFQLANCQIKTVQKTETPKNTFFPEIAASFIAGLFSFLAPCLLPLFPAYFSVITGYTFADLYGLDFAKIRLRVLGSSLLFSMGFSLVYTMLGATGSVVGQLIDTYLPFLLKASGVALIILGLIQTGLIKLHALQFDYAWKVQKKLTGLGGLTAVVTGIAAALSWIPCVGPLLTPILFLAAKGETALSGAAYLFSYSLGLTVPFIIGGIFFPAVVNFLKDYRKLFHTLSVVAGIFLIVFGFILIAGKYRELLEEFNSIIGIYFKGV
ncbi:hypothetical protein A2Y99_03510 [Candidatus Gottesmanbacteria bacterium RBG_13_37_7]|uniref:Cytochrome C biogenesis protein transmembrane domain-containing protein n=1 Tax=Candidatus Gottesmanbacteria bacterium RBG_13_37_7 TaxID=1798369 RepID=A0A1F5YK47_9BACT|nr:MAG: hypothetical protein A2Y99_03510 [Candidatus Gottesmanbacteria bacterium RBG_13_37_7]